MTRCLDNEHAFTAAIAERMGHYGDGAPALYCVKCGDMRPFVVQHPNAKSALEVLPTPLAGFRK